MTIELLFVLGCAHVDETRRTLVSCLNELGMDEAIEEREGRYPSPSILVDGQDVMGPPASAEASCRIDVPTRERILGALRRSSGRPR
jgi:hypothetical protein